MRRNFLSFIIHSAKGSEWKDHKYIKKVNGEYYYPENYDYGRHLDKKENRIEKNSEMDEDLIEKIARDAIKGVFGNGKIRKDLLGKNYQQIQDRVNEIMSGKKGNIENTKMLTDSEEVKESRKIVEKVISKSGGMNLDTVYSVYKRRRK